MSGPKPTASRFWGVAARAVVVAGCRDDDGRTVWRVPCRDPAEELSVCQTPEKKVGCAASVVTATGEPWSVVVAMPSMPHP
jgi:hypothetical protein